MANEKRVAIIGTKMSGKTTMIGLMDIATGNRAAKDRTFSCIIDEKTSGVMDVADGLCNGMFPPRTPTGQVYEADFVMHKKRGLSTSRLRLPIVESAGEDLSRLIKTYSSGLYNVDPSEKYQLWNLYEYVLQSVGFIFIVACDEIRGLGPQNNIGKADLNATRLLDTIIDYKEWTKSPPIEGVCFLFTKYDQVTLQLKAEGITLDSPDESTRLASTQRFLEKYMRNTYRVLGFYENLKSTLYLPSWVMLEYRDGTLQTNRDESPRIFVDGRSGLPHFSEYYYNILINWLFDTFT